jgi:1-deoxy-D-xylulose-5-phosphate reductoisomerase
VFPALDVARKAGQHAGSAPAVMNAANEECVQAFIERKIDFNSIVEIVEIVVNEFIENEGHLNDVKLSFEGILEADIAARIRVQKIIESRAKNS